MLPTVFNTVTVFIGASIGCFMHHYISERYRTILFQSIGLSTLLIGIKESLHTTEIPLLAFSMIGGGLLGEWLNIEERLKGLGGWLKRWFGGQDDSRFLDAFVYASLLFCVGAMTLVGTFRAGVLGDGELLYTKSVMDGFAAMVLASGMGSGVAASAVFVLLFQGSLTLIFMLWGNQLPEYIVTEVGASGGLLIIGISINLLNVGMIKIGNLIPGMVLTGLLVWVKHSWMS